jgi:hypothetical protein
LNRIPLEYKSEALPLLFILGVILPGRFLESHKHFEISAAVGTEFSGSFSVRFYLGNFSRIMGIACDCVVLLLCIG